MSKTYTPWFSKKVKPHRVGVYETKINFCTGAVLNRYQHWDGTNWGAFADTVKGAQYNAALPSFYQQNKWRGLAKKP